MMVQKEEVKKILDQLLRESDISKGELVQILQGEENDEDSRKIERKQINTDIEPREQGVSDVGVSQSNPSLTDRSVIGGEPVIGERGMKNIGDRIFGRRRE